MRYRILSLQPCISHRSNGSRVQHILVTAKGILRPAAILLLRDASVRVQSRPLLSIHYARKLQQWSLYGDGHSTIIIYIAMLTVVCAQCYPNRRPTVESIIYRYPNKNFTTMVRFCLHVYV